MKHIQVGYVIRLLFFLILISFLFPSIKLFGFGMKLDLLFIYPLFFLIRVIDKEVVKNKIIKTNSVFGVLIFLSMFFSNTLGSINFENSFKIDFPTEYLQILNRIIIFYCFFYIAYYKIVKIDKFVYILNIVFLISLTIGALQAIGYSPIVELSKFYALSENQTKGFESLNSRIYGTSGNILTWAGLCGFLFFYFLYFKQTNKYLKILGLLLCVFNIVFSLSRGAILALVITIVIANFIKGTIDKNLAKSIGRLIQATVILFILSFVFYLYFPERIDVVLYRFQNLNSEVNETGRSQQIENIQLFMNGDYLNYLFGIGKNKLDQIGLMEIEFFFNLFAYGVIGVLIVYLWLFNLIKQGYSTRNINADLALFLVSSFIFYLFFSFGYFFIKEIYSGLIFWLIIGYSFGYIKGKQTSHEDLYFSN